jgi:hypothetical protein
MTTVSVVTTHVPIVVVEAPGASVKIPKQKSPGRAPVTVTVEIAAPPTKLTFSVLIREKVVPVDPTFCVVAVSSPATVAAPLRLIVDPSIPPLAVIGALAVTVVTLMP